MSNREEIKSGSAAIVDDRFQHWPPTGYKEAESNTETFWIEIHLKGNAQAIQCRMKKNEFEILFAAMLDPVSTFYTFEALPTLSAPNSDHYLTIDVRSINAIYRVEPNKADNYVRLTDAQLGIKPRKGANLGGGYMEIIPPTNDGTFPGLDGVVSTGYTDENQS